MQMWLEGLALSRRHILIGNNGLKDVISGHHGFTNVFLSFLSFSKDDVDSVGYKYEKD